MPDALVLDQPQPERFSMAEPGEDRSVGERLHELAGAVSPQAIVRAGADVGSEEGQALLRSALDRTMYVKLAAAEDSAKEEAAARRIDAIKRATGIALENPFLGGYGVDARRRVSSAAVNDPNYDPRGGIPAAARQIFDERVDAIMLNYPDKVVDLGLDVPLEAIAHSISTGAEERYSNAQTRYGASGRSTLGGMAAEIGGGVAGGQRDPITLASWVAGPAGGVGRGVLMRVLSEGLTQGTFNLALGAAEKPIEQAYRERRGQPEGSRLLTFDEALHAFGFGALGGMAVRGGIELGKSVMGAAARSLRADHAIIEDRPPGVAPEVHEAALEQAMRHAADPATEPPPPMVPGATTTPERAEVLRDLVARTDDPVEVVETMRTARELVEAGAASGTPDLVDAAKLATLSDPAWQAVKDGRATPGHGLIAAEQAPNPADHAPVLERIAREPPTDAAGTRLIAADEVEGLSARREVEKLTSESRKPKRLPGRVADEDMSLIQYLISTGGLKPTPDLLHIFGGENPWVRPYGKLFKPGGKSIDDATELLRSEGFLHDPDAGQGAGGASYDQAARTVVFHQLLDALAEQPHMLRGGRTREPTAAEIRAINTRATEGAGANFDAHVAELGGMSGAKSAQARIRKDAIEMLNGDPELTVEDSYDRALRVEYERESERSAARGRRKIKTAEATAETGGGIPNDGGEHAPAGPERDAGRDGGPDRAGGESGEDGDLGRQAADLTRAGRRGVEGQLDLPGVALDQARGRQAELPLAGGEADAAIRARLKEQLEAPLAGGAKPPPKQGLFDPNTQHDIFDLVPTQREDGRPLLIEPAQVAQMGERHSLFADLARSCTE